MTSVSFGNLRIHGSELRSIAGLRSSNFTISCSGDVITFTVYGYGHGVGMSQYGAKAMADGGSNYREIVLHYYTGVMLERT